MSARKLVCQGLVLGPVVMLGFLGLGARAYHDAYDFDAFGDKEEAIIASYVAPMREVNGLPATLKQRKCREITRAVASHWVALLHQGKLKPMPGGASEDYAAKDQVLMGRYRLIEALNRCATAELEHGGYSKAADDTLLAMHLAQIAKETDLATIYTSARRQSMLQCRLEHVVRHLPARKKHVIARGLLALAREDGCTLRYLSALKGSVPPGTAMQAVRVLGEKAVRIRTPGRPARPTQPNVMFQQLGARVDGGPGMFALACIAERVHYAGLRELAAGLGLKRRLPDEDRRIGPSEIALGGPAHHAG